MRTRASTKQSRAIAQRDALLRTLVGRVLCASPTALSVLNPYWGDLGAKFAWGNASYPRRGVENFGDDDTTELTGLLADLFDGEIPHPDRVLAALARTSPVDAIDLLWMVAAERADVQEAEVLAEMGAQAAALAERVAAGDAPNWPADATDDQEFLARLTGELTAGRTEGVPTQETFGGRGGRQVAMMRLREALGRVAMAAPRTGASAVRLIARRPVHAAGTEFIGDVLAYFRQREEYGARAPIALRVADALEEGARLRCGEDPRLVVVAHSMGGNIVYDLLSHLRPDLECDALVTVGSQVGLFAELGQFPAVSPPDDPLRDRAPVPHGIGSWINVFDPGDPLSFVIEPVFAAGQDFRYSTGRGLGGAHTAYFWRPSFYRRLAERLTASLPTERHV